MLKLPPCLSWCKPHSARRCGACKPDGLDPSPQDEDRPLGCGWFDSSHELERGLQVREADAEALGALSLSDWLELELRTWCGQLQPG